MASPGPASPASGEGSTGAATAEGVKALNNVSLAVGNIETQLEPLLSVPWQTLQSGLRDDERAKLNVTLAYTLNSLYYMFLRTKGINTKTHKVQGELERIKGYMTRLQLVKAKEPPKPGMRIDQGAAHRMVVAGLAGEGGDKGAGKSEGGKKGGEGGGGAAAGGAAAGRGPSPAAGGQAAGAARGGGGKQQQQREGEAPSAKRKSSGTSPGGKKAKR